MKTCVGLTILLMSTCTLLSFPYENNVTQAGKLESDETDTSWTAKMSKDFLEMPGLNSTGRESKSLMRDKLLQAYSREELQVARNKQIVHRFTEVVWNQGDLTVVDELVTESYAACGSDAQPIAQHRCIKIGIRAFRSAFPDGRFTITDMIAEDDKVVAVQSFQGTHLGEFNGMRATENKVSWTGIFIYRIQDGKIAERWSEIDTLKFMMQIGAIAPRN